MKRFSSHVAFNKLQPLVDNLFDGQNIGCKTILMKRVIRYIFFISSSRRRLTFCLLISVIGIVLIHFFLSKNSSFSTNYRQRIGCKCVRPNLRPKIAFNHGQHSCSEYATQRGPHQRVIAISLFGPKEKAIFQLSRSVIFLKQLIRDVNLIYRDRFLLRVYHDETIGLKEVVCPIECAYSNVDFCYMKGKSYIPPKIWRFLPAGDPLVDISKSRISFEQQ